MPGVLQILNMSTGHWAVAPAYVQAWFNATGLPYGIPIGGNLYYAYIQDSFGQFVLEFITERIVEIPTGGIGGTAVQVGSSMPSPNLSVNFEANASPIPWAMGTCGLSGQIVWGKTIETSDTSCTFLAGFYTPIVRDEVVTLGIVRANATPIYDPATGTSPIPGVTVTFVDGDEQQLPLAIIEAEQGVGNVNAMRGLRCVLVENLPLEVVGGGSPAMFAEFIFERRYQVQEIFQAVATRCGVNLTCEGFPVDELADSCVIAGGIGLQDWLRDNSGPYNFSIIDGDPVRLVRRPIGAGLVLDFQLSTSVKGDFIKRGKQAADSVIKYASAEAGEIASQINFTFMNQAREYQQGIQYARLPQVPTPLVRSNNPRTFSSTLGQTDDEALQYAWNWLYRLYYASTTFEFATSDIRIQEGDIGTIATPRGVFVVQIVESSLDPDNTNSIIAKALLPRLGIDATADSGTILQIITGQALKGGPSFADFIVAPDGTIWEGILNVEGGVGPAVIHVSSIDNPPSTIPPQQYIIGGPGVFGDADAVGIDNTFVYLVNSANIIRVSRAYPFPYEFLPFTIDGFFVPQSGVLAGGKITVSAISSAGLVVYSVDTANFTAGGVTNSGLANADVVTVGYGVSDGTSYFISVYDNDTTTESVYKFSLADVTIFSSVDIEHPAGGVGNFSNSGVLVGTDIYWYPNSGTDVFSNYIAHTTGNITTTALAASTWNVNDDLASGRGTMFASRSAIATNGTDIVYIVCNSDYVFPSEGPQFIVKRGGANLDLDTIPDFDSSKMQASEIVWLAGYYYVGVICNGVFAADGTAIGSGRLKIKDDFSTASFWPPLPLAPTNDNFADALTASAGLPNTGSTVSATVEASEPDHAGVPATNSIWWNYTPPTTGLYLIDARASTNPLAGNTSPVRVAVYTGGAVGALTPVASSALGFVTATLTAATTYRIAIDGAHQSDGTGLQGPISFVIGATAPPANDDFADAVALTLGATVTGTTLTASRETGEPDHAAASGLAHSIWYKFTPASDGDYRVTLKGSTFDTVVGIYTGAAVDTLTQVGANNDDAFEDPTATVPPSAASFHGTAGVTYSIAVDGPGGAGGLVSIKVTKPTPPTNDNFANAINLSLSAGTSGFAYKAFNNTGATKETGEPDHNGNAGGASIWYKFTPVADGFFAVNVGGIQTFAWNGAVYTGASVGSLTEIDSDSFSAVWSGTAGVTYYIAIDGVDGAIGDGDFFLTA